MWLAVLFVLGSCLPLTASDVCPEVSEDTSSWVKLKPLGHCRDGESTCPYRITFPQLTIQLPKPFRELEKMSRELQSLMQTVNQLKADCRECKERQRMQWNLRTADGEEDGESIQASRGTVNTKERQQDIHKTDKVTRGNIPKTEEGNRELVNSGKMQGTPMGSWGRTSNPSDTEHRHENSGGPNPKVYNPIHMDGKTKNMSKVREPHLPLTEEKGKKVQYPSVIVTKSSLDEDEVQTTEAPHYITDTKERQDRQDDVPKRANVVQDTTQIPPLRSTGEDDTNFFSRGTEQLGPAGTEDQMWSTGLERNTGRKINTTGHKNGQTSEGPKGSKPIQPKQVTTTGMENQRWTSSWDRNSNPSKTGHRDEDRGGPKGSNPTHSKQVTATGIEIQRWNSSWDRNSNSGSTGPTKENSEGSKGSNPTNPKQVTTSGMKNQRRNTSREWNSSPSNTEHTDESNGGPKSSDPTHLDIKTKNTSKVSQPHLPLSKEEDKAQQSARITLTETHLRGNQDEEKQLNPAGTVRESWHTKKESSTVHNRETSGGPRELNPAHMGRRPDSMGKVTESRSFLSEESDKESPKVKLSESHLPRSHDVEQTTTVSSDIVNTRAGQQEVSPKVQGTTQKTEEDAMLINSAPKNPGGPGGMEKQKWSTNRDKNPTLSRTRNRDETEQSGDLKEANPTYIGRGSDSLSKVTKSQSDFLSEERGKKPESSDTVITRDGEQDKPHRVLHSTTHETEGDTIFTNGGRKEKWNPRQDRNFNLRKLGPRDETKKESNPEQIERTTESPSKVKGQQTQEEEQTRHGKTHKDSTSNMLQQKNPSGALTAEGKVESILETSIDPMVLVDHPIEKKQLNQSTHDKPIKRFPGFPRLIHTNRTAVQGTPNTGNRLENPADPTKRFSPIGNRTVKYFIRGSGFNPVMVRPKEKTSHKADKKEGTGTDVSDIVKNSPKVITSKNVSGERPSVTGTKAKNNIELNLNMTETTKTVSVQQGKDITDPRTRVKEPTVDETIDSLVTKEGSSNMVRYSVTDNKNNKEKVNNHGTESVPSIQGTDLVRDTKVDAKPINPVDPITGSVHTDPQTQDSQSENSLSSGKNAERGIRMDSSNSDRTINGPVQVSSDLISDRAETTSNTDYPNSENLFRYRIHEDSGTEMHSSPINTAGTGVVDASSSNPQGLDKLKPDHNTTAQGIEEIKISNPIKKETETQSGLRNHKATSLKTDPVKQTSTARSRDDKTLERSTGRPRPSNPHPRNNTKIQKGAKELSQPNLRAVKNVTRSIPNHSKQPERTASGRVIQAMNPKSRKPYILHTIPENRISEPVVNSSGVNEHMVDTVNARNKQGHPKTGPTSARPNQEIKSTATYTTQSIRPTVAGHHTVDHVHLEKAKTAPTVEAINSPNTHQIQNTLQNSETKLFHVTEPGNPGGKRKLDPVTDGVREQSVETEIIPNIVSLGSSNQSRTDSDQAGVEKIKNTDRQKGINPFQGGSVDSNQEKSKTLPTGGRMQNPREKILTTVEKVITEQNKLKYSTPAATSTIKSPIKNKQSQITAPVVTTPHFMTQDHAEKAKSSSGEKVTNTHVLHRLKNPSQEEQSKTRTGTINDSDKRNKEQDPIRVSTDRRAGGPTKLTVSLPNSVDNVPNRATDSIPLAMDKITNIAGPKWSAPSTDRIPHSPAKSIGNSYPVAVNTVGDTKIMSEGILIEPTTESAKRVNTEKTLMLNNLKDKDGLEDQLLSTCRGQCNPSPTAQPNIQRSSENNKDKAPQDCSGFIKKKPNGNGVYSVTPDGSKKTTFNVSCDMKVSGGGWTVIQHRFDGSISFNRTWHEYKKGFGNLTGEFWLGNDKIHQLTSSRAMVLRIELEDLDGVKEYAQYNRFRVANESQHYQLTIGGYSGTAGNAMQFSKKFNHDQKNFTTPDRDNDRYPSGNCGAYYSSGWWFDACMAANLNGKYYETKYKGVRNGIFWGTWHNISSEYYLTNDRQSFKTVRMMVRPRMATGRDY